MDFLTTTLNSLLFRLLNVYIIIFSYCYMEVNVISLNLVSS